MKLDGKNIVVTGGASGIGRATVQTLCEAGARVFFGDINEEGGAETAAMVKGDATFHRLDISDDASITAFRDAALAANGQIDVVANVAGWDVIQPFIENTPDFWEKIIAINLMGPVKVTRSFLDPMIERNAGKVINVASDAGRVGSMGETMYAGAKGGIIAFTKSLARGNGPPPHQRQLRLPGTDRYTAVRGPVGTYAAGADPAPIPFKRLAQPHEIADAILFFASGRSDYLTGQVLSVSGGLTMVD